MELVDKQSAEHYAWGNGCDGWHLVKTPVLSVIEERMPPGTSEVRHYHQKASQFFYVLRGTLFIEVDGKEFELNAGQSLPIAAGRAHQVRNSSAEDVGFLVISNPPSHGDRVIA
jgi:mannose-6-phosphate isomerase-like protein (cupin superfamily)